MVGNAPSLSEREACNLYKQYVTAPSMLCTKGPPPTPVVIIYAKQGGEMWSLSARQSAVCHIIVNAVSDVYDV